LRFLETEADRIGADRIALAHQLEDQLETLALRLARGTGLRGLGGIPDRRGRFVRPLLGVRRARLEAFLEGCGVDWIDDASNRDPRYARSRMRHDVLPLLRRASSAWAGSDLDEIMVGLCSNARAADVGLDAGALRKADPIVHVMDDTSLVGSGGAQIARSSLADYDPAVLARILRILARNNGFRLSRGGTALGVEFIMRGASGHAVDLGGGLRLAREYEGLRLYRVRARANRPDRELAIESATAGTGTANLGGRVYEVAWGAQPARRSTWTIHLDADALAFPLRLRAPRPGDRIRTPVGSRKLKKLLNERRVPRSQREQVPVLECADGRVLWVAGHQAAQSSSVQRGTGTFLVGVAGTEADGN
jgi:tRNA(Ile)-lysidine synthase